MDIMNPYKWLAATQTADLWREMCRGGTRKRQTACKAYGIVWHDRYLCGDVRSFKKKC